MQRLCCNEIVACHTNATQHSGPTLQTFTHNNSNKSSKLSMKHCYNNVPQVNIIAVKFNFHSLLQTTHKKTTI